MVDLTKALQFGNTVLNLTQGNNSNFMGVYCDIEIMRDAVCNAIPHDPPVNNPGVGEMSFSEHYK